MSDCRMALILVGLLFAWPLRGEATELTGFGPVEFGMTKDETIAALGSQKIWIRENRIKYWYVIGGDLPSSDDSDTFDVNYYYTDGRVTSVSLFYQPASRNETRQGCASSADRFASMVGITYGKNPIIYETILIEKMGFIENGPEILVFYTFSFENTAFIQVKNVIFPEGTCTISFWYHPPEANPIPF